MRLLAMALAWVSVSAMAGTKPALVNLPKLKPLAAPAKPAALVVSRRVVVLELATGPRVEATMARTIAVELFAAVQLTGRFDEVLGPAQFSAKLPLEAQQRLSDCALPSCLIELGALMQAGGIVSPRLTLEQDGFRFSLDYMDLGVEARWRREVRGQATASELKAVLPALVGSLWGGKAPVSVGPPARSSAATKGPNASLGQSDLLRWGAVVVGVGGLAAVGSSYMVMRTAQEDYEPATATAKDYDQLAGAQTRARLLWGAGLALTGAGVAGFSLLGR